MYSTIPILDVMPRWMGLDIRQYPVALHGYADPPAQTAEIDMCDIPSVSQYDNRDRVRHANLHGIRR